MALTENPIPFRPDRALRKEIKETKKITRIRTDSEVIRMAAAIGLPILRKKLAQKTVESPISCVRKRAVKGGV